MSAYCATCGYPKDSHGNFAVTICERFVAERLECLDMGNPDDPCSGEVEYRMALSATGRSFPRCAHHWSVRLAFQAEHDRRYPVNQPSDFDPSYAGESWGED